MSKPSKTIPGIAIQPANMLPILELSLSSAAKIAKIQMMAAGRALEESAEIGAALAQAGDHEALIALRTRLEIKGLEQVIECSKQLYEVVFESRTRLLELINQSLGQPADNSAPTEKALSGLFCAAADLKEYLAASSHVIENLGSLAQQAGQMAQANMENMLAAKSKPAKP